MQSMKSPQGPTDPRVTMTDSPVGGLLSPSFASVLAFDEPDDPAYQDLQGLEEEDHGKHNIGLHGSVGSGNSGIQEKDLQGLGDEDHDKHTGLHDSVASNSSGIQERNYSEGIEKQPHFPRLELDAAMDEYHALDGPADQFNPQNTTPVSNGGGNHPASYDRQRYKAENIRTSSAPQASPVKLDWLEENGQIDREDDGNSKTTSPKRRLSVSDQLQSASRSPNTPVKNDTLPLPTPPVVKFEAPQSFERYVRFSPDNPSQFLPPRSPHRPLPSVERKQDYISLHRLHKQQEKWRGRSQRERISPRRSPTKIQASTLNRQPDIHFLSIPKPDTRQRVTRSEGNLSTSDQTVDTARQEAAHGRPGRVYDLVVLNLGLYRSQYPQGSRWAFWRVRMCPTFIPARSLTEDAQDTRHIVYRLPAEDLILHFVIVVPYFIVRIPVVTLAKAGRLANSRAGISFLDVVRIIWALVAAFINFVLRKICGMEFGFYGKVQTEYPDQSQTRARPV
ncbi:uncharacterized protein N7483_009986 [Penicillium malachiteum]|uniref:uncharacterized protein n=1 Tax=Penicillium malachiteum TaxID=1324776 RepID=UPI002546E150|nr:uncharacterized protein N7483_009986 [Penicillium malachiteum]KAJ5718904.1 hypothetical protein N7483_009986 [Penicillium malachiteum]